MKGYTDEYKDARNARYRERHKNDVVSAHGQAMRDYFRRTNRESRSNKRAERQAKIDIRQEVMNRYRVNAEQAGKLLNNFYEEE